MNLKWLKLKDFRRFDHFEIDFHPELTVIAARNGQGKTTILEAIASALGPFVGAFDMGKGKHIERSDARYSRVGSGFENEQNFPVEIWAAVQNPDLEWGRLLNSPKGRTTTKEAMPITVWGNMLQSNIRLKADVELPVISYYPSGRLWITHKDISRKAVISGSRTIGYEDCLSSASNFQQMQRWMADATGAAQQEKEYKGYEGSNLMPRLLGIQNAVNQVMEEEGWSQFHYSLAHRELVMWHEDHGLLPISLLSDGVRAMISLTADLAFRCARLNGQFNEAAPQRTSGIVLIDEVDLHLHPAWQQRVMGSLRKAFPKVQFIVSSHSPQVISTVPAECIRIVVPETDAEQGRVRFKAKKPVRQVEGVSNAEALAVVFDVDPVPDIEETRMLGRYMELIAQGIQQGNEAMDLRRMLEGHFGHNHPQILECDRLIRLQEFKRRMPKRSDREGQDKE